MFVLTNKILLNQRMNDHSNNFASINLCPKINPSIYDPRSSPYSKSLMPSRQNSLKIKVRTHLKRITFSTPGKIRRLKDPESTKSFANISLSSNKKNLKTSCHSVEEIKIHKDKIRS